VEDEPIDARQAEDRVAGRRRQRYLALARLRLVEPAAVDAPLDRDPHRVEVDVAPLELEQLARPQARVGGEGEQRAHRRRVALQRRARGEQPVELLARRRA
jgi:hypothetical protein